MTPAVYTIGHSTHTIDDFLSLLRAHGINEVIDVRRYPGSKRYPHFGSESLRSSLEANGIGYRHAVELGGRRTPSPTSQHTAWRSSSFRAYADYMETPAFQQELERLVDDAATLRQTIMCAEAVPWRCHRQLISDALVARGIEVCHIITEAPANAHKLTPFARVTADGLLIYDASAATQTDLALE